MKKPIKHFAVTTLTATALGLLLAGPVLAANPVGQPTMLAASETMNRFAQHTHTWMLATASRSSLRAH